MKIKNGLFYAFTIILIAVVPTMVPGQTIHTDNDPTSAIAFEIKKHAAMHNIHPYTGDIVHTHVIASAGNTSDGWGYYEAGELPNSYFYYVHRTNKVFANWGVIRYRFAKAGSEIGSLGWPSDDEFLLPDGAGYFQRFDHGYIYWHPKFGAFIVKGMIFDTWGKNNWEKGVFGYPLAEEVPLSNVKDELKDPKKKEVYLSYQDFQNGRIYCVYDYVTRTNKTSSTLKNPNFNPSRPH